MLLSIIIPTKNRYTTLFNVVDMILSFQLNNDIEIVIQDNSDNNNEALEFISERTQFLNLQYYHSAENLSVIDNSNKAVLNSTGEFVCFIGDDDAVMPNIVDVTNWMKKNKYKVLKSYMPSYYWPNQKSNYLSNNTSGILKYRNWSKSKFEIINTIDALNYTLKKGGVFMNSLPCLYHGIVAREVLDLIFYKASTFFPGPSPDMSNAIALTQVVDTFVYVDFPVVISGKSTKSTGGAGILHKHISKIEDVSHLPKNTSANWDIRIPKYWTGPTIWAESVIKSLETFGNKKAISSFNFEYMYAYLAVFNKRNKKIIFKDFKIYNFFKFNLYIIYVFFYRIKAFVKNRLGTYNQVKNIKDISNAVELLSKIQ